MTYQSIVPGEHASAVQLLYRHVLVDLSSLSRMKLYNSLWKDWIVNIPIIHQQSPTTIARQILIPRNSILRHTPTSLFWHNRGRPLANIIPLYLLMLALWRLFWFKLRHCTFFIIFPSRVAVRRASLPWAVRSAALLPLLHCFTRVSHPFAEIGFRNNFPGRLPGNKVLFIVYLTSYPLKSMDCLACWNGIIAISIKLYNT